MIDFTNMPTRRKTYAGANGGKIAVIYEGEQYMLKFPAPPKRNLEISYIYCPQYKHTLEKERDRWMNLTIETQRQLDCTHNRMRCLEYRVKELERGG